MTHLSGWGVVGLAALGCCLVVGLAAVAIAVFFRFTRHHATRRLAPPRRPAFGREVQARVSSVLSSSRGAARVRRWALSWLVAEHVVQPVDADGAWALTDRWLKRRRVLYGLAIGIAAAAAAAVVATAVVSINDPLVNENDGEWLFSTLTVALGIGLVLIVVSTVPWHFGGPGEFADELREYWLDRHAGRLAALYLALIAAFCVVIIVGLSSSLGGNVSYFQVGHHYFESGGDCYTCPSTAISKSTYLSAARGSGIADSWGYLVGAVVCVLVGTTLHRASRTASAPGRVAHPEPPLR